MRKPGEGAIEREVMKDEDSLEEKPHRDYLYRRGFRLSHAAGT